MSRILKPALLIFSLLVAGTCGYWYGGYRAKDALNEYFISETFSREYHEARHDLATLRLLTENKTEDLLQVAQYRYYSRLLLAADIATRSSNPNLVHMLQAPLAEAQAFQKTHPYTFRTEQDQKKWVALTNSPR